MLWRMGLLILVLVFGQVLAEEAVIIENTLYPGDEPSRQSRIVSGWEAYPGQHPHHAALRVINAAGSIGTCGGALVSRQWVITAAHCTAGRITIVVRLGVTDLATPQDMMDAEEWFTHPTFNDATPNVVQVNDISMVKLPRRVVYTILLRPIRIQSSADAFRNYDNEVMYTTGHGRLWTNGDSPQVLHWVYLRAISNEVCQRTFSVVNQNSICARWFNVTSQSPCAGDGGGPLVHVDHNGVPILVGLHYFRSNDGCHVGLPAGFIRPGPFHSWFTQVSGIDFQNFEEEEDIVTTTLPEEESTTRPPLTTTQEPEADVTSTIPPTTTEEPKEDNDSTTTPPTTTEEPEEDNDSTTRPTTTEVSEEDNYSTTKLPPPPESTEVEEETEEEQDSDDNSDDSSVSESDERPSGTIIKKKKLEMKMMFKVKLKKEYKQIQQLHSKNKHPARTRLSLS